MKFRKTISPQESEVNNQLEALNAFLSTLKENNSRKHTYTEAQAFAASMAKKLKKKKTFTEAYSRGIELTLTYLQAKDLIAANKSYQEGIASLKNKPTDSDSELFHLYCLTGATALSANLSITLTVTTIVTAAATSAVALSVILPLVGATIASLALTMFLFHLLNEDFTGLDFDSLPESMTRISNAVQKDMTEVPHDKLEGGKPVTLLPFSSFKPQATTLENPGANQEDPLECAL